ncbi:MAG: GntP family permease [Phaeodactylibacter sp.]|nr:GntP family permease [Phaeodactylibacter sp.]
MEQAPPPVVKALLPLLIPILLILLRSIAQYPTHPFGEGTAAQILTQIGHPVVALFAGALFALWLPKKLEKKMLSANGWVGRALQQAAIIILITGAGGALGAVLKNSEIGTVVSGLAQSSDGLGLLLPFLLAAALKTAQGSSTVAIITTASIIAPILPGLGLDAPLSKAMAVIAIGAGSAVVSHINDSFFWVVTQLSGFSVRQGYRIHSLGTLVLGFSAILFLSLLSLFI